MGIEGRKPASQVRRALAGILNLPRQAPSQPHTSLGAWGLVLLPQLVPLAGRWGVEPCKCLGSRLWREGPQFSQTPTQCQGQQGPPGPGQLVLKGAHSPTPRARGGQLTQDPSKCCRTAWESEVRSRPRAAPKCLSARCQARPQAGGLSYQPFVPGPAPFVGGSSGGSWCTRQPWEASGPTALRTSGKVGQGVALGRDQMGHRALGTDTGALQPLWHE